MLFAPIATVTFTCRMPERIADGEAASIAQTAPSRVPIEVPKHPFDALTAQLPLICKDCAREFTVPYRHFQAGVVFHCPHCHGSYVPRVSMYLVMTEAFEKFIAQQAEAERVFAATGGDREAFAREKAVAVENFYVQLKEVARAMHPAGKVVRRKGLRAMFT